MQLLNIRWIERPWKDVIFQGFVCCYRYGGIYLLFIKLEQQRRMVLC